MTKQRRIPPLQIEQVLNGFVVKVGCQTVVFNDLEDLLVELRRYVRDPAEVENYYGWKEDGPEVCPPPTPGLIYPNPSFGLGVSGNAITTAGYYQSNEANANQYVPREQAPERPF